MAQALDIGVDLGNASVVIYGKHAGIMLNQPAVIAVDRDTRSVLAVGEDARRMIGRTPRNIEAIRPIKGDSICDLDMVSAMLRVFVRRVSGKHILNGPRVVISVPSNLNDTERGEMMNSLYEAGARRIFMMERPIAAALGAKLPIGEAYGEMVCDIGGGVTDIAVISMGRMMTRSSVKVAGDQMDDAIIRYLRRKHNLLIGEITAEHLKRTIGSAIPHGEMLHEDITGRNVITGLPKTMRVYSDEITEAIYEPVQQLIEGIHGVLERTPAELAADVFEKGITLTGGGAQLSGLCEAVSSALKVTCKLAEDPQTCVARGCGLTLENWGELNKFLVDRRKFG